MKIFFDASAFAKRYIIEAGSDQVEHFCQQASHLAISIICVPEIISALTRLQREAKLTVLQYQKCRQALLADIDDIVICTLNPTTVKHSIHFLEANTLRAMDALHIACAYEWGADFFITADKRQAIAAKQARLKVAVV